MKPRRPSAQPGASAGSRAPEAACQRQRRCTECMRWGTLGGPLPRLASAAEAFSAFEQAIAIAKRLGHVGHHRTNLRRSDRRQSRHGAYPKSPRPRMAEARTVMAQVASWGQVYLRTSPSGTRGSIGSGAGSRDEMLSSSSRLCLRRSNLRVPGWRVRMLAIHLAAANATTSALGRQTIAAAMGACFTEPAIWWDWPATVYASYLKEYGPPDARRSSLGCFIREIRRELYPAPSLLRDLAGQSPAEPA